MAGDFGTNDVSLAVVPGVGAEDDVQMGLEMEKVILAHLDVVLDDTRDDSETDVLFEARRLIEVSINNPVRLFAQLLVPKYGAKAFTRGSAVLTNGRR